MTGWELIPLTGFEAHSIGNGSDCMWTLYRPKERQLIEFLIRAANEPLNANVFHPSAATSMQRRVSLGTGAELMCHCVAAMRHWFMVPEGVDLYWPERPACVGTTLAMGMRVGGIYWLNPCRITECAGSLSNSLDRDAGVRIRWETVLGHCLVGHESFRLGMEPGSGEVFYEVSSTACPVPWLRPWKCTTDRLRGEFQRLSCERFVSLARHPNPSYLSESSRPDRQAIQIG